MMVALGTLAWPAGLPLPAMNPDAGASTSLIHSGLWKWISGTGLERFELLRSANGWDLHGTILALGERGAGEVGYKVSCDSKWRTQTGNIHLRDESGDHWLRLAVNKGGWFEHGKERHDLAGCIDVDLGWSPITNTLPIRRLGLKVGERSAELYMAWVRFPELTVELLPQRYERVGERTYMYTSRGGSFKARIDVDKEDLVVDYEGAWQRVTNE